jgi:tetratricopeptide (TPR) repeat protein
MIRSKLILALLMMLFSLVLKSCFFFSQNSKIEFLIAQTPKFELNEMNALQVGSFKGQPLVNISLPVKAEESSELSPGVLSFEADQSSEQVAELLRSQIIKNFSKKSSLRLLNTSDEVMSYTGVIPDPNRVVVISALVRYSQIRQESKESVPYFVTVFNEALPIEQQLLARGAVFGAEGLGGGIEEETPYVELMGALEVRISLNRQSNGEELIPPQTLQAFYVGKWGGKSETSHLPENVRLWITENFQEDENLSERFLNEAEKTRMISENYNQYLAQGYNLRRDSRIPLSNLDLQYRLTQQLAQKYVAQVVPTFRKADLRINDDGDEVGITLLRGNAYEEAITYLQGRKDRTASDDYNLGLAYEAIGQRQQAKTFYESANRRNSEDLFEDALNRVQ